MKFSDRLICVIPAKDESTRLPHKNILPLGGHPLIAHPIRKAVVSGLFDTICVSTESADIAKTASHYGAGAPFLRPAELAHDPATIVDVCLHAIEQYEMRGRHHDILAVLLPTSPFVELDDITDAIASFRGSAGNCMLSVTKTDFPPFNAWQLSPSNKGEQWQHLTACFPDSPFAHTKSTECPLTYRSNGAILIADIAKLKVNQSIHAEPPLAYVMPEDRSLDIDTGYEYKIAQALWATGFGPDRKALFNDC